MLQKNMFVSILTIIIVVVYTVWRYVCLVGTMCTCVRIVGTICGHSIVHLVSTMRTCVRLVGTTWTDFAGS